MKRILTFTLMVVGCYVSFAQPTEKLGLLQLEVYDQNPIHSRVTRVELEKLGVYEVIDVHDIEYMLKPSATDINNCFGKLCLVEVGKAIHADKMFTGSIEAFSDRIVIQVKLVDIKSGSIVKSQTMEFYHYPQEIQRMLEIAVKRMHDVSVEESLVKQLVRPEKYSEVLSPPIVERLKLSGPRMGFTYFTGDLAARIEESKETGGFGGSPIMYQFGYQFETQYLNEGNLQALFEFIPLITGVDQGYFIPSLTILHGIRNNRSGWEFALGPSIHFVPEEKGYYDSNGRWTLPTQNTPVDQPLTSRTDSRGDLKPSTEFVLAIGKTFRSGRLNIPINAYFIPEREGFRYGLSFGFNAKKQPL